MRGGSGFPLPPPPMGVPLPLPTPKMGGTHGVRFPIPSHFEEVNAGVGGIHTPHSYSNK